MSRSRLLLLLPLFTAGLFPCCTSPEDGVYSGRRWFVHSPRSTCFFWGYLKKSGESWRRARLVIMDERVGMSPPDRLINSAGIAPLGDDHNCEYRIVGRFTGATAYDPNSDLVLPLFAASSFKLESTDPGDLPGVGGRGDNEFVPAREAGGQTPARIGR